MKISLERFNAKPEVQGGECYRMFVDDKNMGFVIFPLQGSKYGILHKRYLVSIEHKDYAYALTIKDDIHGKVQIVPLFGRLADLQMPANHADGVFVGCKDCYFFDEEETPYIAMMEKVTKAMIMQPEPIYLQFN